MGLLMIIMLFPCLGAGATEIQSLIRAEIWRWEVGFVPCSAFNLNNILSRTTSVCKLFKSHNYLHTMSSGRSTGEGLGRPFVLSSPPLAPGVPRVPCWSLLSPISSVSEMGVGSALIRRVSHGRHGGGGGTALHPIPVQHHYSERILKKKKKPWEWKVLRSTSAFENTTTSNDLY